MVIQYLEVHISAFARVAAKDEGEKSKCSLSNNTKSVTKRCSLIREVRFSKALSFISVPTWAAGLDRVRFRGDEKWEDDCRQISSL